jgi:hypothetical protein
MSVQASLVRADETRECLMLQPVGYEHVRPTHNGRGCVQIGIVHQDSVVQRAQAAQRQDPRISPTTGLRVPQSGAPLAALEEGETLRFLVSAANARACCLRLLVSFLGGHACKAAVSGST